MLLLIVIVGDQLFWFAGRFCLYSPWGTVSDIAMVEDIFWIDGRKPDVVFLGDSRIGSGINPVTVDRLLSREGERITSVNIWIPAAGPDECRKIITRLLAVQKPRLILCDINENTLHVSSLDQGIGAKAGIWRSVQDWVDRYDEEFDWQLRRLSGTLHWGDFVEVALYNVVSDLGRQWLYGLPPSSGNLGASKGYRALLGHEREVNLATQRQRDVRAYPSLQMTDDWSRHFREFLAAARDSRLPLVLLLAPVSPELSALFPPERYQAFVRYIKETADDYGIPFVNYYRNPALPADAFFDYHHLTRQGAEAFSHQIVSEILEPALKDWHRFKYTVMDINEFFW